MAHEMFLSLFQSPILEPAMTSYEMSQQQGRRWPQYVAALAATGGALAAGELHNTVDLDS